MKRTYIKVMGAIFLMAGAQQAFAANTLAGTDITNTATVNYTVSGVTQTAETDDVVFKVDRKINVVVAEVGNTATPVAPGEQNKALTFTVTNATNAVMDFKLTTANGVNANAPGGLGTGTGADTDTFDPINGLFFVDDDDGSLTTGTGIGNGTFDANDVQVTFLDEIPAAAVVTVHVVSDIPNPIGPAPPALVDGNLGIVTLAATAAVSGTGGTLGADAAEDNTVDVAGTVQNVFADVTAGDTDAAVDGKHSDTDAYVVASATITVTKSSIVLTDPLNLTSNPKAIPGATVLYCIEVKNTGGTAATAVSISDPVPANTTYVSESIKIKTDTVTAACTAASYAAAAAVTDSDTDDLADGGANTDLGNSGTANPVLPETLQATDTHVNTSTANLPATNGFTTTYFKVTLD